MTRKINPATVPELEVLIHRIYTIVSGPRTALRDWDDIRSLFWSTTRVISIYNLDDGSCKIRDLTVEDWILAASAWFATMDFYERGVILDVSKTARLCSISSPYESRHNVDGPVFERGVNHYSFLYDGNR